MARILAGVLVLATLTLGACAGRGGCSDCTCVETPAKADGTVAVINTICPVEGDDFETKARTPDLARTWKGASIGFCCETCVTRFDKMTDADKSAVASAAAANKQR